MYFTTFLFLSNQLWFGNNRNTIDWFIMMLMAIIALTNYFTDRKKWVTQQVKSLKNSCVSWTLPRRAILFLLLFNTPISSFFHMFFFIYIFSKQYDLNFSFSFSTILLKPAGPRETSLNFEGISFLKESGWSFIEIWTLCFIKKRIYLTLQ